MRCRSRKPLAPAGTGATVRSPTAADIEQYATPSVIEVENGAAHDTVSRMSLALQTVVIPGRILVVARAAHPVILIDCRSAANFGLLRQKSYT